MYDDVSSKCFLCLFMTLGTQNKSAVQYIYFMVTVQKTRSSPLSQTGCVCVCVCARGHITISHLQHLFFQVRRDFSVTLHVCLIFFVFIDRIEIHECIFTGAQATLILKQVLRALVFGVVQFLGAFATKSCKNALLA
jgi:hypothetical protein